MFMLSMEQLKEITNQEIKLLEEYDYDVDYDSILKGLKVWNSNKNAIREALRNHQNWNEELQAIQFEGNYSREIDKNGISKFSNWIYELASKDLPFYQKEDCDKSEIKGIIVRFSNSIEVISNTILTNYNADYLNARYPQLKAREGQKMTKIVNKFCGLYGINKLEGFNKQYAAYCDSITPAKMTRKTLVSINPLDYLTMSFGNSWSSCHTIDKNGKRGYSGASYSGCFSGGTLSYMLDETSMIFYTISNNYSGNKPFFESKINRCMFHLNLKDEQMPLIQGRLYPQSCDNDENGIYSEVRAIVQKILADCIGFSNLWKNTKGTSLIDDIVDTQGVHYPDYTKFSTCNTSIPSDNFTSWDNIDEFVIGHSPICPNCGDYHGNEENICCEYCSGSRERCCDCGGGIDDTAYYIDGESYCGDCCFYCDHCGEYHPTSEMTTAYNRHNDEICICDDCRTNYYTLCDHCEQYHYDNNIYQVFHNTHGGCEDWCEDCRHDDAYYIESEEEYYDGDYVVQCDHCGDYHLEDNVSYDEIDNSHYCEDCYEKILEQRKEDEDESEDEDEDNNKSA